MVNSVIVPTTPPLSASMLYAMSQGTKCEGKDLCHWCAAPCPRLWFHDDAPPVPFFRSTTTALRPSSPYMCQGCWHWRRKSITVFYLNGKGLKDRQCPLNNSWWVTEKGAWGIRKEDYAELAEKLLDPPRRFILAMLSEGSKQLNLLQLAIANDHAVMKADSPLVFTLDNIQFKYSIYELKEALDPENEGDRLAGKNPGVQKLVTLLGLKPKTEKVKLSRGRPPAVDGKAAGRVIRRSGVEEKVLA